MQRRPVRLAGPDTRMVGVVWLRQIQMGG
jgi:hypothetical protein